MQGTKLLEKLSSRRKKGDKGLNLMNLDGGKAESVLKVLYLNISYYFSI